MPGTFTYTALTPQNAPAVAAFPQNPTELFFMFPRGTFPFTAAELLKFAAERFDPTVCLLDGEPAGYAVFRKLDPGVQATIGNVVTSPAFRRRGVCRALMQHMIELARSKHGVKEIRLAVFNENTAAILLYASLGFIPYAIKARTGDDGTVTALLMMKIGREDRPVLPG